MSSLSASSFHFSSPAALSAGRHSPVFNVQWLVVVCSCLLPSLLLPAIQQLSMMALLCCRRPALVSLIFGPNAVVIAGSGAGLSVGTKPLRRTSWSSSASGHHIFHGSKARGPALAAVVVVSEAGPHSLRCRHRPCLHHYGSHCCCRKCHRCSPHLPLSSSCNCQHFCRQPPPPIADLHQPLFYPSCPGHPSPLLPPSMVGCCVLHPPSSIPTT